MIRGVRRAYPGRLVRRGSGWRLRTFLLAGAVSSHAAAASGGSAAATKADLTLSVDGLVQLWIGMPEVQALGAIPTAYARREIDGGWELRAAESTAQPYFIGLSISSKRLSRVSFNWPVASAVRVEAFFGNVVRALPGAGKCSASSTTSKSEGGYVRRIQYTCGQRRLTAAVGEWSSGPTADITLE